MSSRIEDLLTSIINDESNDIVPNSRAEKILKNIIDENYEFDTPNSRLEGLLINLASVIQDTRNPSIEWTKINPNVTSSTVKKNGLTFEFIDGFIVVNGTSDSNTLLSIYSWVDIDTIPSGHSILMTFGKDVGSISTFCANISFMATDESIDYDECISKSTVHTTGSNINKLYYSYIISERVTFNNTILAPQIYDLTSLYGAGNEPENFDDTFFIGSPSLVNLFAINGNVDVNYTGENQNLNTVQNGVLTCNANSTYHHAVGQMIDTEVGEECIFSGTVLSLGSGSLVYACYYKEGTSDGAIDCTISRIGDFSFIKTATSSKTLFGFATGNGTGATITNIQVRKLVR